MSEPQVDPMDTSNSNNQGQIRPREEDDDDDDARNVQPRNGNLIARIGCFRERQEVNVTYVNM